MENEETADNLKAILDSYVEMLENVKEGISIAINTASHISLFINCLPIQSDRVVEMKMTMRGHIDHLDNLLKAIKEGLR